MAEVREDIRVDVNEVAVAITSIAFRWSAELAKFTHQYSCSGEG